jgi:hypothetical protein
MQITRQRIFGYGKSNSELGTKRFTKCFYTGTFVTWGVLVQLLPCLVNSRTGLTGTFEGINLGHSNL